MTIIDAEDNTEDLEVEEVLTPGSKSTSKPKLSKKEREQKYANALAAVFEAFYKPEAKRILFEKDYLDSTLQKQGVKVKNIPDLIYSFRSRRAMPDAITKCGHWGIDSVGRGWYGFIKLTKEPHIMVDYDTAPEHRIKNLVPEIVEQHLRADEQSMLSLANYNDLVSHYMGFPCFFVQAHYRSTVRARCGMTEIEIDALWLGQDRDGKKWVLPCEGKSMGDNERLGRIQLANMSKMARQHFTGYHIHILAMKALSDGSIGLVGFGNSEQPDDFEPINPTRFLLYRSDGRTFKPRPKFVVPKIVVTCKNGIDDEPDQIIN